ncbi:MAG: FABP family protein [Bifidobacteriaceae bacterium]|jgi:hypothetical protein|nr:FABP family protein [Bifidobacteriaceae bacterium]
MILPDATELAHEVYPLAWLVGLWRGQGSIGYGPIKPGHLTQELRFTPGDGPYLTYSARTWLMPGPPPPPGPPSPPGPAAPDGQTASSDAVPTAPSTKSTNLSDPAPAAPSAKSTNPSDPVPTAPSDWQLWHEESGFWRVSPGQDQLDPPFQIEAVITDAAGYLSLYLGQVDGPRIDLGTDAMVRSASAPEVNAATRMYGLVNGELFWAWDIAGFGEPLGSYMALQLRRSAPLKP